MFQLVCNVLEGCGREKTPGEGGIPAKGLAMVDFNFDVNELFRADITAVRSDLIPVGYLGNKNHSLVQQQVRENREPHVEKYGRWISSPERLILFLSNISGGYW